MKIILIVFLIIITLFISGCGFENYNTVYNNQITYSDNWISENIDELGLQEWDIAWVANGVFSESDKKKYNAYILSNYSEFNDEYYHKTRLAVETSSSVFFYDLFDEGYGSYFDDVKTGDFDGDGDMEIAVNSQIGISGGAGQYELQIFNVTDGGLKPIFSSKNYDTGYFNSFESGYKVIIKNRFTEMSAVIDYSAKRLYEGEYFDESGYPKNHEDISCDSFYSVDSKDYDKDGIDELLVKQYVSLNGHSDYIGDAKSVLKYNSETGDFTVVKAEFIANS